MARNPIDAPRGYTIIELLIAMSLATFVAIGVMMVTGSATRFAVVGNTRGDVASWSLVALHQLNTDIENASYIQGNSGGINLTTGSDKLSGCQNYNGLPTSGAVVDTNKQVLAFYYCVATVAGAQSLLRYTASTAATCPISPTPTCGSGNFTVIAKNIHRKNEPNTTPDYFRFSQDAGNAIEMHFIVGVGSSTSSGGAFNSASVPAGSGLYTPTPQVIMEDTVVRTGVPLSDAGDLQ